VLTQLADSGRGFDGHADVQETTFALDAFSRFVCNTIDEVADAQQQGGFDVDVVVIGSGMYGAFTAAKIYERGRRRPREYRPRVLVLESGPFLISEHFQNLTRIGPFFELVNRPAVDENQSFLSQINYAGGPLQGISRHHRCVGGKSLFWGGWAPPLMNDDQQDDLAQWPREVRDFLLSPEGYAEVDRQIGTDITADYIHGPLMDHLLSVAQRVVGDGAVPQLTRVVEAPIAVRAEGFESGLLSMGKFSSLPLLLDSIREDAEGSGGSNANRFLFLVPNAEVLRIETAEGRATTLVLAVRQPSRDANKPGMARRIVRFGLSGGAMVCLAGNAINSTRLALNSFPKPRELGPDLTGKNLMVHVRGNYSWRIRKSALQLPSTSVLGTSALHVEGRLPIGPPVNRLGRFHFQFYAVRSSNDSRNYEEYLYRLIPNVEDLDEVAQAISSTDMDDWIVVGIRTCGETFGDQNADPSHRDSSSISVNPFGGGGDDVYFDEDDEAIRIPKVFVTLIEREADAAVRAGQTQAAFAFVAALVNKPAAAAWSTTDNDLQFIGGHEDGVGTTYHESGTLWLGEDPDSSVTDVHGHFHHVTNVFCVDQAIFPTVGSANPVPTGLALSSLAARHILTRFTSAPLASLEEGFVPIFDGTLDGWDHFGEGVIQALPGLGIIECGSVGAESRLGFIRTRSTFENFVLRLDWKAFDIRANSGVFLRMPGVSDGNPSEVYANSIEIQIDETGKEFDATREPRAIYGSSLHKTGAVYGIAPATRWASKAVSPRFAEGYWNAFEITVNEDRISVWLNGEPVVRQAHLPADLVGAGAIGLQTHTDVVQFRNIRIREI
jgi:3-keto-disaccharide hydrolase/GMC oxidoreductase